MSYFAQTTLTDQYGFDTEATPTGEIRVIEPYRMVGTTFIGATVDPNFWTSSLYAATASQNLGIQSLTVQSSSVQNLTSSFIQSLRTARHLGGVTQRYRASIRCIDNITSSVVPFIHRWGCMDAAGLNGCYFERSASNFNVVTEAGGVETRVSASNFNQTTGVPPTFGNFNTYEIYYGNTAVYFTYNDVLYHKVTNTTANWSDTPDLGIRKEVFHPFTGFAGVSASLQSRVETISRLGPSISQPNSNNITNNAGNYLKYGSGMLRGVTFNRGGLAVTCSIKDGTGSAASVGLATIYFPSTMTPTTLTYNAPFYTGLTVSCSVAHDITVNYE